MEKNDGKLIVVAVGGNSLIKDKAHLTVEDQYERCLETCQHLAALIQRGHRLVVTHGNGPQVGFVLRRSELSREFLHDVPMDSCVADTQGAIGYQIQKATLSVTKDWETPPVVATVVTQVLVDAEDPAFLNPAKPIGSFMDQETAEQRRQIDGWEVVEDSGRGWRRVVASPAPKEILELAAIRKLVEQGVLVVAAGGGGIPVVRTADGTLVGAAAVVDKDHASSLLARNLDADILLVSTAVEKVCLSFGKENEKPLDRVTVAEAKQYLKEGHFAPGSMKPKVEAVVDYLEAGGQEALITDPPNMIAALDGRTGTRFVR